MKNNLPASLRREIFTRDKFSCQKCNFEDETSEDLELHHIIPLCEEGDDSENNLITLCSICHNYAPDSEKDFALYLNQKIKGDLLDTFRHSLHSISKKTKQGMKTQFVQGKHLTKAPRGYKIVDKQLIPATGSEEIALLFQEFLETDISLTRLAKNYNMTTAGIKKLLKNATYLGKVKFAGQISDGQHEPLIQTELFNNVQDKLEKISFTKN